MSVAKLFEVYILAVSDHYIYQTVMGQTIIRLQLRILEQIARLEAKRVPDVPDPQTVREIVAAWLREHGYDGLKNQFTPCCCVFKTGIGCTPDCVDATCLPYRDVKP